jgi:hypothetical protein
MKSPRIRLPDNCEETELPREPVTAFDLSIALPPRIQAAAKALAFQLRLMPIKGLVPINETMDVEGTVS